MIVTNTAQVNDLLNRLSVSQLRKVLNPSIRKTLKPIVEDSKDNLKNTFNRRTGETIRSLGISGYKRMIGLGAGARTRGVYRGFVARFLNDGTVERFRVTRGGRRVSTGKVAASNFFNDAVSQNMGTFNADLEANVITQINKLIQRGVI